MNKRFQISYYLKIVLNCIIYVVFFAYIIYSAVTAKDIGTRLIYLAVGLIFGSGALLYEFLRFQFDLATKQLVFLCNPKKAMEKAALVRKCDLLKTFDSSVDIMNMLAYLDLRDFDALEKYIAGLKYDKISNYDVVIVVRHSQMVLYGERKDSEKFETAYKQLIGLRSRVNKKGKHMKGAYFYNWEVVAAEYQFYRGSGMEALRRIREADTRNMNKRELLQYYMLYARICLKIGRTGEKTEYIEHARKVAGSNEAAQKLLNSLNTGEA